MQEPWKQLAIFGPCALLMFAGYAYSYYRRRFHPPIEPSARENTYQPPPQRKVLFVCVVALLVLLSMALGVFEFRRNPTALSIKHALATLVLWLWPVVILLLVTYGVLAWLVYRDPELKRIVRRLTPDNARELLHEVECLIQAKPTEKRHIVRSELLYDLKRFDEALAAIDAAEAIRKSPGHFDAMRAPNLFYKGEQDAALEMMARVSEKSPDDFEHATNHCILLAEAGHRDEALSQLDRAEYLFKQDGQPKVWTPLLKVCRDKLDIATGFEVVPPVADVAAKSN